MNAEAAIRDGWSTVEGISTQTELLELGASIGTPVRTPNGELVKEIRVQPAEAARSGSKSAHFGTDRFPLHTDTAYWPTPAKFVVLRVRGDMRRPTTVVKFRDLLIDPQTDELFRHSIWRVAVDHTQFYCPARVRDEQLTGWRFDADLMRPANAAARKAEPVMRTLVMTEEIDIVSWSEGRAAIICNWTALHGRGAGPQDEGPRILERLYVR